MSLRVVRHGGAVCGCKHIQGFNRDGPSAMLPVRDPDTFYRRNEKGEVTGGTLAGYQNDLFLLRVKENVWPAETGKERLTRIVERLKKTYKGHRIEAVLKAGRWPDDTEKMTPYEIKAKYSMSGQIVWEPLLLELGFVRVGPQFYNSNSGNWLRTYHLYCTPETFAKANKVKAASKPAFR